DIIDKKYDHSFVMFKDDVFAETFKMLKSGNYISEEGDKINGEVPQNIHFVNFIPTAENLAKHWFKELKEFLDAKNIAINHVTVWETPTSSATYTKEDYKNDK
ncbi:MAG: 6-carboxytetrahydropterin synthase, partial [Candidatus Woesearchaeota archaeon]